MLYLGEILINLALLSNVFLFIDISKGKYTIPKPPPSIPATPIQNQLSQENINIPTPTEVIVPTAAPTLPIPTSTLIPTHIPTHIPTQIPTIQPMQQTAQTQNNNTAGVLILAQINDYRTQNGLVPFLEDKSVCDFAGTRVNEVVSDFSHYGFDQRVQTNSLPYPSYSKVTENIASTANYTAVFDLWKNSPGHNENLLSNTKFACVQSEGKYFVFESWGP